MSIKNPKPIKIKLGEVKGMPPKSRRSCNRHSDCDEADRKVRETYSKGKYGYTREYAEHCDDPCCEDCFGY